MRLTIYAALLLACLLVSPVSAGRCRSPVGPFSNTCRAGNCQDTFDSYTCGGAFDSETESCDQGTAFCCGAEIPIIRSGVCGIKTAQLHEEGATMPNGPKREDIFVPLCSGGYDTIEVALDQ